ncbi:hypothetical protein OVA24_03185 [Luteolibacter sp. SL250]|uniref:hypothetical protein n=1 Tax=Luteolibacter sp. SL250 TaxID=2995170 RepID=UPI00226E21F4|nr:hypothetical protein [Luteolibacter sp. SL250]WAC20381.1 hypothetical protein OVA24_03185 [Luteolibacter sp. SL250]
MRTTLDLPDPIFRDLKIRAAQEGVKMKELVEKYIVAGLRGQQVADGKPLSRSPLPVFRESKGSTAPALSNAELQEILDKEDVDGLHH